MPGTKGAEGGSPLPVDIWSVLLLAPQHVVLLALVGLWLWYWELAVLSKKIDLSRVILCNEPYDIRPQPSSLRILQSTRSCVARITKIVVPMYIGASYVAYRAALGAELPWWQVLAANTAALVQLAALVWVILRSSRMVRRCVARMLLGGGIEGKPLRTNYILLADTLTSYGKPLMDFTAYLVLLFRTPLADPLAVRDLPSNAALHIDLVVGAIPSVIRLVQCLREYRRKEDAWAARRASLFNALKYSSQLPILVHALLSRSGAAHGGQRWVRWAMLLNSVYSFWWDVTMDWKLGLFNFSSAGMERDEVLRHRRLYSVKYYYGAVLYDFVMKFMWLWELHVGRALFRRDLNPVWLHLLEVIRRWIWTFFKIEAEYFSANAKK
ncbi:AAR127Cp [Eremothecium gossypii ATCC 10895]|uniref:AAR127Cp n=1 Tax=Eremothecium gossypii (strain ATCC 10895 / CBS 109.51 / FGSC 9923 / NRRL Y-1056) TaxID=284811 RepID=Q75EF4_EREGS|nr:AAR127Cp [Eremothecium gossypii ATCC 10895]AAS50493.1 AAR127Cp [Eremothecium gossypii ATCC 10895]AEY94780.1 FAAR127Cp [Eremothecium gossypii FDAG1]